ncbi:MAG: ABC transporter substrate-binding protein [bacterium]
MSQKSVSGFASAILTCLILFPLWAKLSMGADFPLTVEDSLGRRVTFQRAPERIISMAPSNTEILFALGLGDRVIGVTNYCNYPPEATKKPKIGGFSTPNIELIVSMEPDLILASAGVQLEAVRSLEKLGVKLLVIEPQTVEDTIKAIELVGRVAGRKGDAGKLADELRGRMRRVVEKVKGVPRPRVFVEIWHDPFIAAGPGTVVDDVIRLAGGENIAAGASKGYPTFSLEALLERDPEVYISVSHTVLKSVEEITKRQGFARMSAVKNGRVFIMNGDIITRSGPRIVDALEMMARAFHPDVFGGSEG